MTYDQMMWTLITVLLYHSKKYVLSHSFLISSRYFSFRFRFSIKRSSGHRHIRLLSDSKMVAAWFYAKTLMLFQSFIFAIESRKKFPLSWIPQIQSGVVGETNIDICYQLLGPYAAKLLHFDDPYFMLNPPMWRLSNNPELIPAFKPQHGLIVPIQHPSVS